MHTSSWVLTSYLVRKTFTSLARLSLHVAETDGFPPRSALLLSYGPLLQFGFPMGNIHYQQQVGAAGRALRPFTCY